MAKKDASLTEMESGTTRISMQNAVHMSLMHGPILGIIHSVDPDDVHATKIFYADGFAYLATGFTCGYSGEGPRGLLDLVNMIPFLGGVYTQEKIASLNEHKNRSSEEIKDKRIVYYLFQAPTTGIAGGDFIRKSAGMKTLKKEISIINNADKSSDKKLYKIIDGADNDE